jgi:hypothetical protein
LQALDRALLQLAMKRDELMHDGPRPLGAA